MPARTRPDVCSLSYRAAGKSFAFQHFTTAGGGGLVAFAGLRQGLAGGEGFVLDKFSGVAMQAMFGGGGFNLATLEGEGKVILQSMTGEALGHVLATFARRGDGNNGSSGLGAVTGLLGGRGA